MTLIPQPIGLLGRSFTPRLDNFIYESQTTIEDEIDDDSDACPLPTKFLCW